MATTIVFAGSDSVRVEEDVHKVFDVWTGARGLPFELTAAGESKDKIWINPATVAYWHEAKPSTVSFGA